MDLKTEIREYFYKIHGSHIETDIANIIAIAEKHIALQLLQTDVSGSYNEEDLINSAKYGYEFHQNTSFPKQSFEQCCKNNFLQHLWATNIYKKADLLKKQYLVKYKEFVEAPHALLDDETVVKSKIVEVKDVMVIETMFKNIVDINLIQ